jgi:hypothetical protein
VTDGGQFALREWMAARSASLADLPDVLGEGAPKAWGSVGETEPSPQPAPEPEPISGPELEPSPIPEVDPVPPTAAEPEPEPEPVSKVPPGHDIRTQPVGRPEKVKKTDATLQMESSEPLVEEVHQSPSGNKDAKSSEADLISFVGIDRGRPDHDHSFSSFSAQSPSVEFTFVKTSQFVVADFLSPSFPDGPLSLLGAQTEPTLDAFHTM